MVAARMSLTGSARNTAKTWSLRKRGRSRITGNQQDHLTQQGQKEGDAGLAQRHEGLLAGELHPQHEHTGGIDVQRPDGDLHQLRLVVKQRDKQARKELQRRAGGAAKAQGGAKRAGERSA